MPTPALAASRRTVSTSHASCSLAGWSMTCAPVLHLAIDFDISSEMIEPVKPTTAEKASSGPSCSPACPMPALSSPSRCSTTPSTSITARLVAMNRTMRFMALTLADLPKAPLARVSRGGKTLFGCARPGINGGTAPAAARGTRPGIAQRDRPVENRPARRVVLEIGDEVAVTLELEACRGRHVGERGLDAGPDHALGVRIEIVEIVAFGQL